VLFILPLLLNILFFLPSKTQSQTLPANFKAIWYQNSSQADKPDAIPDLFMAETNVFINQKVKALGRNTIYMNNIESRIANHLL
jgi:hypothetical protein